VVHTGRSPNDPVPTGLGQIMRKDLRQYFQKHRPRWEQGVLHVDTQIYRLLKRQSA
jgi:hypothetical protein